MDNKNHNKRGVNNRGTSNKTIEKPQKRLSLTEGVDMLIYGPDTNLREVERCLLCSRCQRLRYASTHFL